MNKVRSRISLAALAHDILYAAVYVVPGATGQVDFHFRKAPSPRVFERNVLHHPHLHASCVAADGVLWSAANGPMAGERPLVAPTQIIGTLVAAQPAEMRPSIEDWLALHHIRYGELVMVPPEPGEADAASSVTGRKASLYRRRKARLFVVATEADAAALADAARCPVYSAVTRRMIYSGCRGAVRYTARARDRLTWLSRDLLDRVLEKIRRLCRRNAPKAASSVLSG
jgi:orotate phosphoribosyltransferase